MPTRLAFALFLIPTLTLAQPEAGTDVAARVDALFARWSSPDSPGCAVGVWKAGQPVLSRAYGMANLEHGVPITPDTVFEAGSVSKQFTVAAVLLLEQQGKLSLDDAVRKHVPELPDYGAPLTLRHLVHHTSGLRDWGTVVDAAGWPRGSRIHTHAHVLEVLARQRSLNYPTGTEFLYSNSGYNLLAIIVERVSGQSFSAFTREHLFEPLGMAHTQWRDDFARLVKGRATAYVSSKEGWRSQMPFENVYGNGGLLTTVGDLLRWNENFVHERVGGRALIEELQRKGRLSNGREIEYAGGLFVSSYRGVAEVGHGGATAGYRAYLTRYPDTGLSVALLCNVADIRAGDVAHQVADVFLGAAPEPLAETPAVLTPEVLAARAGLYRSLRTSEPLKLLATEAGLQVEGGDVLSAVSDTRFLSNRSRMRLDFTLGRDGRTRTLSMLLPDGDSISFEPVKAPALTPSLLAGYVGTYASDEAEASYAVRVVDGGLVLERRHGVVFRLEPAYADVFKAPELGLVSFRRGAGGRIEALSLGLGRVRDLRFRRVRTR
jgi:CubicO group peptidase (beta-lactamase class C family)